MHIFRWPVLVACAAILAVAAPVASNVWARGGGGGKGGGGRGGKRGGMGNPGNRGDYMEEMQRADSEDLLALFRDDATREPIQRLRFEDRTRMERGR